MRSDKSKRIQPFWNCREKQEMMQGWGHSYHSMIRKRATNYSQPLICMNTINIHDLQWANKVSKRRTRCLTPLAGQNVSVSPCPPAPAHFTYHLFHLGASPSVSGVARCDPSKSAGALLLRCCRVAPRKSLVVAAVTLRQRRQRLNGDFSEAYGMQRNWAASEYVDTWALFCWDTGISSMWTRTPLPQPPVFDLARLFVKWSASDGELEEKFNLAGMLVLQFFFFLAVYLGQQCLQLRVSAAFVSVPFWKFCFQTTLKARKLRPLFWCLGSSLIFRRAVERLSVALLHLLRSAGCWCVFRRF